MKRSMLILVALVTVILGALAVPASAATFTESFETGFGAWQPDTDGRAPAWSVTRTWEQAYHGSYSLKVFMDGRQDDGTTWVERQFAVAPWSKVTIQLTFQLWSRTRAFAGGWAVVAAAGSRNPEAEGDFTRIGLTEEQAGWKTYGKSWTVAADSTGKIWVALGTSVEWEVQKHHFVDYVQVTITQGNG